LFVAINKGRVTTLYNTWSAARDGLLSLNKQHCDIYVTVNETKGNKRELTDIIRARAIWQEDDRNSEAPDGAGIVVETSKEHYHRYWLTSTEELDRWQHTQDWMVKRWHSDPKAKDLSRVLRVPGFLNWKRDEPEEVKLLHCSGKRWEFDELYAHLGVSGKRDAGPEGNSTIDKLTQEILRGEHLHGPIRTLMLVYANKGLDKVVNRNICTGLIGLCPDDAKRHKALHDLEGMLKATYDKVNEEQEIHGPIVFKKQDEIFLEWPPGLMGELARAANDFAVVPNKIRSIMTALGLIAGIAGRRYNISRAGLNIYVNLMATTGSGKDAIRNFCFQVLSDNAILGNTGITFLGSQNYTGPKPLWRDLIKKPSMLAIFTEAGLLYQTDSGDKVGFLRVLLEVYGASGKKGHMSPEAYSNEADNLPMLRAPSLSVINEATEISFKKVLQKRESLETGDLPRSWAFICKGARPYDNPNHSQLALSETLSDRLRDLSTDCFSQQTATVPEVVEIAVPECYTAYSHKLVDEQNRLQAEGDNRYLMYTRAGLKVLKVAGIIAALEGSLKITPEVWEWSTKLLDYEMAGIAPLLSNDSAMDDVRDAALRVLAKLIAGGYHGPNVEVDIELRSKNRFKESPFKQVCERVSLIKSFADPQHHSNPKSGAKKILIHLLDEGYIKKIDHLSKGRTAVYELTKLARDRINQIVE
jgi:hypothetical protein